MSPNEEYLCIVILYENSFFSFPIFNLAVLLYNNETKNDDTSRL